MRVAANGDVYVPDSEDEASGMEVESGGVEVADLGVSADGIAVGPDRVVDVEDGLDAEVEGVPVDAVEVAADGGATDGVKVAADASGISKEMHPEVAARLKVVLAHMDSAFHDIFVGMYKVMVPAFFKP
ncbi:hypothetical protein C2845_PM16G24980 [Panicum miliaceum]|uniref:Uncharacterized protein n=1 Tax=Panicum miliaceum TaxID=4540 RepID=A0A3L6PZY1_PANMI|nr:hypothetical protein C2845_PM16G24980 [Panicum miliaceum]